MAYLSLWLQGKDRHVNFSPDLRTLVENQLAVDGSLGANALTLDERPCRLRFAEACRHHQVQKAFWQSRALTLNACTSLITVLLHCSVLRA